MRFCSCVIFLLCVLGVTLAQDQNPASGTISFEQVVHDTEPLEIGDPSAEPFSLEVRKRDMSLVQKMEEIQDAVREYRALIVSLDSVSAEKRWMVQNQILIQGLYIQALEQ